MPIMSKNPFCACSTPVGIGGIAVIRISGDGCGKIIDKMTRIIRSADGVSSFSQMRGYTMALADFFDIETNKVVDRVVLARFEAPHSYTGQEMAEISCHGGNAVKQEILRLLLSNGCDPAGPGEFTKTAFFNGKIDLSSAEAVMDVIAADSQRALMAANTQLNGRLNAKLASTEEKLYKALAIIEMIVEFPEHDDTPENDEEVLKLCNIARGEIDSLCKSFGSGRMLSERMRIALCGLPNSGKSSLLNCLSGYDRAIVTQVPGTTRDTLEVELSIEGIPVTLVDTAGIRKTSDEIEAMGVTRAKKAFEDSDMVLYLVSPDTNLDSVIVQLNELLLGKKADRICILFSKCDSGKNSEEEEIKCACSKLGIRNFISVSAKDEINVDVVKELVVRIFEQEGAFASQIILINARHYEILKEARENLDMAIGALNDGVGVDVASSVIRLALDRIGQITGKTVSAELVDTIFSKFCIGK